VSCWRCWRGGIPEDDWVAIERPLYLKRFQRACRRAGVRVVRFRDLRHTFGTRIAASGEVSLRTLQEWMGHCDAKTTLIYADYQPGEHESEIISRAFGAAPARPDTA
jgi:integrase